MSGRSEMSCAAPDVVAVEDGDDLVVGLAAVDHLDAADDAGIEHDVRAVDVALGVDADIQRVTVRYIDARAALGDFLGAVGARNKAVERRRAGGGALRAVDHQKARSSCRART
jgi:hypothetical protein